MTSAACSSSSGSAAVDCRALSTTSAKRPTEWKGTVFTIVLPLRAQMKS